MNTGLRFSKLPSVRICNNCAKVAKYEVRAGIHNLVLCYDCCREIMNLIRIGTEGDYKMVEYDHMKEVSHDPEGTGSQTLA